MKLGSKLNHICEILDCIVQQVAIKCLAIGGKKKTSLLKNGYLIVFHIAIIMFVFS